MGNATREKCTNFNKTPKPNEQIYGVADVKQLVFLPEHPTLYSKERQNPTDARLAVHPVISNYLTSLTIYSSYALYLCISDRSCAKTS
jgi:hypothetical protein